MRASPSITTRPAARLLAAFLVAGATACADPPPTPQARLALPRAEPLVIAHRGASAELPEHTFAAWDRALEVGADYIEQDLQLTADSVLVVLHDAELDRTARPRGPGVPGDACRGPVIERRAEELRRCEVASWHAEPGAPGAGSPLPDAARASPVPLLDSVFRRYAGRARFYVETKTPEAAPGMEEALVALLRRHGLAGSRAGAGGDPPPVLLQSFSEESLRRLAALAPEVPRVRLFGERAAQAELWRMLPAVAGYALGVGPAAVDVTPELVRAAHARCLEVHPYTVNDESEMVRLLAMGVDGLFTDRPGLMRRVVEEGAWREARPEPQPCGSAGRS